jgi:haloalkane dehalogenase
VVARVEAYGAWLASSHDVPKLLLTFTGSPTLMIGPAMEAWCRANIASLTVQACSDAGHMAPEDQPGRIADALVTWAGTALLPTASGSPPAGSHRPSA